MMVLIFPKLIVVQAEEPSFLSIPPASSHFSPSTLPQNLLHISLQHYYLGDEAKLPKYLFHLSYVRIHAADLACTYICRETVIDPPKFEKCYLACFEILFRDVRIQVHPTIEAVKAGRQRVDTGLKPQVWVQRHVDRDGNAKRVCVLDGRHFSVYWKYNRCITLEEVLLIADSHT